MTLPNPRPASSRRARIAPLLAGTALVGALLCAATPASQEAGQAEAQKPLVFDPAQDAGAALHAAVLHAQAKHKRVLVVWGVEEDDDLALVEALRRGRAKDWPIYYEFEIVPVAAGPGAERGIALAKELGADLLGLPQVSVLDAKAAPLRHSTTEGWRSADGWNTEAMGAFLKPLAVEPLDANTVVAEALARAVTEKKRVLVHFGAPW